jgi:uncharacterized membrane protein
VDVQRLKAIYYNQTLPEIFAVSRKELTHSSFLAWLFATSSNHGLGTAPLVQLLELYVLKSREQKKNWITDELLNAIITRDFYISGCTSVTEKAVVTPNAKGRADIVLTSEIHFPNLSLNKLKIVIENKVYSNEHSNQTQKYFDYYESIKGEKEKVLYIYLTPLTSIADANCPEFIHVTYQDLLDHVFEPIRRLSDISQRTQFILNEYISSLSIPVDVIEDSNVTHIQTSILAIGMEEKELLKAFWDKNKELIKAALIAISSDDDNEAPAETQELLQMFLQNISKRDLSKYSINGSGKFGKSRMVEAVVNKYLEEHQDTTIAELKQIIFPDFLQGSSLGVIRTMQDTIKDYSRYYKAGHPKTEEQFFICNQWGLNIINKFVDHVNAANLGIRIEKYK